MVSVEFDTDVNALYLRFKKSKIARSEPLADNIVVDVGMKDEVVGIELLLPRTIPSGLKSTIKSVSKRR